MASTKVEKGRKKAEREKMNPTGKTAAEARAATAKRATKTGGLRMGGGVGISEALTVAKLALSSSRSMRKWTRARVSGAYLLTFCRRSTGGAGLPVMYFLKLAKVLFLYFSKVSFM